MEWVKKDCTEHIWAKDSISWEHVLLYVPAAAFKLFHGVMATALQRGNITPFLGLSEVLLSLLLFCVPFQARGKINLSFCGG